MTERDTLPYVKPFTGDVVDYRRSKRAERWVDLNKDVEVMKRKRFLHEQKISLLDWFVAITALSAALLLISAIFFMARGDIQLDQAIMDFLQTIQQVVS